MPNMRHAFAELNALGHGPSILTIPRTTVQRIHMMASNGDEEHQRVELDMFRLAALHVVEYMQDDVMALAIGLFLDMESSSTATMVRKAGRLNSQHFSTHVEYGQNIYGKSLPLRILNFRAYECIILNGVRGGVFNSTDHILEW